MKILEHPEPEQLIAYSERRLTTSAADELRAHLASCADCTTQLLELTALFDGEDDPASSISRGEMDSAWQRQRARLFPAPTAPEPRRSAPLRRAWSAAASLGLAASLLAAVTLVQWRTITQLRQAQANPPLVNLAPIGSIRQEARISPALRLSSETPRAWVILNPATELQDASYDVDIVAPGGRVVLHLGGLQKSEADNFRLEIPRNILTAGDYRALLFGNNRGGHRLIAEFDFRVPLTPASTP